MHRPHSSFDDREYFNIGLTECRKSKLHVCIIQLMMLVVRNNMY